MLFDPPEVPAVETFDIEGRLEFIRASGLSKSLRPRDGVGKTVRAGCDVEATDPSDGQQLHNFASNDVLDLAGDDRVAAAVRQTVDQVGVSATSSRVAAGDTVAHGRFEQDLAEARRTDTAITFPSTYAANLGVISALYPNVVFSDERNHTSIVEGIRASTAEVRTYDHCDLDALETQLRAQAERGPTEKWLIVTESIYSMDADIAPLADICDLAEEYGAWVVVDGAWGCGLYDGGGGIVQQRGLSDRVDVQIGSLSKALASQGGYVAGSDALIEYLANTARPFLFSTGLNPPAIAAAQKALEIARESDRPEQLHETAARLRSGLDAMGFDVRGTTAAVPLIVGETSRTNQFADRLRDRGFLVNAVPYPAVPQGTSRLRILPKATHEPDDVSRLLSTVEQVGTELALI